MQTFGPLNIYCNHRRFHLYPLLALHTLGPRVRNIDLLYKNNFWDRHLSLIMYWASHCVMHAIYRMITISCEGMTNRPGKYHDASMLTFEDSYLNRTLVTQLSVDCRPDIQQFAARLLDTLEDMISSIEADSGKLSHDPFCRAVLIPLMICRFICPRTSLYRKNS